MTFQKAIAEKENILIIESDEVCYNKKIFWGNNKVSGVSGGIL